MAAEGTSDEQMGRMVGHYSSLFTLPSHRTVILRLSAVCLLGGAFSVLPLRPTPLGLAAGLLLGALFLLATLTADLLAYRGCVRGDPIVKPRRISALSLASCLIWSVLLVPGAVAAALLAEPSLWLKLLLLGFCASLALRLLVLSAISSAGRGRAFLASVTAPTLGLVPLSLLGAVLGGELPLRLFLFVPVSVPIVASAVYLFTALVDRVGEDRLGTGSLPLFRAFLANWMEGLNGPLEEFFERLGSERSVKVSLLAFKAGRRVKAVMAVPAVHPGPFRNVGSSPLPGLIGAALEERLGCVASVPHGLSGHELDLASQLQNRRVVEAVLRSADFSASKPGATPLHRAAGEGVEASCQVFGNCALITLTAAPRTMEDLPQELDAAITVEAERRGLSAVLVDAHNSIDGRFKAGGLVESFRRAAVLGLERTVGLRLLPFEAGAARVVPGEFGAREGLGPGGISVLLVRVGGQKAAYVTVDGNNMVAGLREKILQSLREAGIAEGEVLTTDSHEVAGLVVTGRGYHPVGEAIDQDALVGHIRRVAEAAEADLEPVEASSRVVTVPGVRVIGGQRIEDVCLVAEEAIRRSKRLAASLFPALGAILILLLTLL